MDAIKAVKLVGIGSQDDLYWVLFSQFVNRHDQRELFDQAFHIFWRNPRIMERVMGAMLPTVRIEQDDLHEMSRRLSEAMATGNENSKPNQDSEQIEFDASFTFSDSEVLQEKDFEDMTAKEITLAKKAIEKLHLPIMNISTRRFQRSETKRRVDMRTTLRAALRAPDSIPLRFKKTKLRHPPLVMLCDISGSMSQYSRMFLHFMHAITNDRDRVHCFVFGTRLTNISRHLKHRDVDLALDKSCLLYTSPSPRDS